MNTASTRHLNNWFAAWGLVALCGLAAVTPAKAQYTVDLNGTSQTWTSSLGSTAGYPIENTSIGIYPASVDLGGGITMTLTQSVGDTALPYAQSGAQTGNLNRLDGSDPGINASPSSPSVVANEVTGFALAISSEGADGNTTSLQRYLRYDLVFNQPVYLGNVTITDIDALRLWTATSLTSGYNLPVFQDAIAMEAWSGTPGTVGSGMTMGSAIGSALSTSSIGGLGYVQAIAPTGSSAAATGGLVDSSVQANWATFSTGTAIQGFSIYYFDTLDNVIVYNGGMTVGIQNFTVTPAPEPSGAVLVACAVLFSVAGRRRGSILG